MNTLKTSILLVASALITLSGSVAMAGPSAQTGIIFDHTSYAGGLLIRFDPAVTGMPDNCAGATSNWMLIPESKKTMIAVALIAIASNNRGMAVYTSGIGTSGYCEINQLDPLG
jgi:hypothetical protein